MPAHTRACSSRRPAPAAPDGGRKEAEEGHRPRGGGARCGGQAAAPRGRRGRSRSRAALRRGGEGGIAPRPGRGAALSVRPSFPPAASSEAAAVRGQPCRERVRTRCCSRAREGGPGGGGGPEERAEGNAGRRVPGRAEQRRAEVRRGEARSRVRGSGGRVGKPLCSGAPAAPASRLWTRRWPRCHGAGPGDSRGGFPACCLWRGD